MKASIIFHSGSIWTGVSSHPRATTLAIHNGVIAAIGTDSQLRTEIESATEVIDLHGRTLLAGFQDAHVHPVDGGLRGLICDLSPASNATECLDLVAAYITTHPDSEAIVGDGWLLEWFEGGTPTAVLLDSVVGNRIVFLTDADGHSAWVSSAALLAAGIDKHTADPPAGRIERDGDGSPIGVLHDAAMERVRTLLPKISLEETTQALRLAQEHLLSLGITAWQDAIVTPDIDAAYLELAARNELFARVGLALWWERDGDLDQFSELSRRRLRLEAAGIRAHWIKLMLDGVIETGTAWLLEPYLGSLAGPLGTHTGGPFFHFDVLNSIVMRMETLGFQAHFHAIGDAAIRQALNAVAVARAANPEVKNVRHQIAHVQVVDPDDIERFFHLGVVANLQTLWACHEPQMDDLTIPVLGASRALHQYPFESIRKSGARIACGSDWPVSSANPLEQIAVAVSRECKSSVEESRGSPFIGREALALEDAIGAFTFGSAFANGIEEHSGTLAPSKWADIVVLDQDLFHLPGPDIADVKVDFTLVGGKVVYER